MAGTLQSPCCCDVSVMLHLTARGEQQEFWAHRPLWAYYYYYYYYYYCYCYCYCYCSCYCYCYCYY